MMAKIKNYREKLNLCSIENHFSLMIVLFIKFFLVKNQVTKWK